ncbi:MAG: nitrogenase cofactor biosynthesis protein NifB [Deltaproteobacteria bacterium]|nr:nitrogenase cofactor biosynthesis protein NifB [Deltaproteobacteria bacterium]
MRLENHPCFNEGACRTYGRIHLPVASRCNIQCNFCNRKFDCVNESRPGVTSGILSPDQAIRYLDDAMAERKDISVVGIAGPGDPFANPFETIRTMELIREKYPEMLLCLASNGLNLLPYVNEIVRLNVSHVSITVNAVDPSIGARIYSWVRSGKSTIGPDEGARILLENQIAAIKALKEAGVIVKINSVVIPGINLEHILDIAKKVSEFKVDIFNCMPYYPNEGSNFEHIKEPSKEVIIRIRKDALKYVKQMHHCTRCRADAVGLLGEVPDKSAMEKIKMYEKSKTMILLKEEGKKKIEKRKEVTPLIAVASLEGVLVNLHLGEAVQLRIYKKVGSDIVLDAVRDVPEPGGGDKRWEELSDIIKDCSHLLVSGAGDSPRRVLLKNGVIVHEVEGMIEDAVRSIFEGKSINHMIRRKPRACGSECEGKGMGCG